ncbi:hypothetical protein BC939DRAFT_86679 [Gamsiella multidivaricata]|uniref:uncharacterized protein n=1 Tax=Gamsiella multidivaricata TaxID=101098 RepID=UPI0022208195|nr:uncharacterized protein BC939DRAFT_86679 [Gamsiella multidivaricata]KAG0360746.1 hypothetical protein BGZ54_009395 [Gamsiella multidivaricata]KAI7827675.1 hypothetical protein BC939DRAFT_86679 [Gamsiella multidivaricata]
MGDRSAIDILAWSDDDDLLQEELLQTTTDRNTAALTTSVTTTSTTVMNASAVSTVDSSKDSNNRQSRLTFESSQGHVPERYERGQGQNWGLRSETMGMTGRIQPKDDLRKDIAGSMGSIQPAKDLQKGAIDTNSTKRYTNNLLDDFEYVEKTMAKDMRTETLRVGSSNTISSVANHDLRNAIMAMTASTGRTSSRNDGSWSPTRQTSSDSPVRGRSPAVIDRQGTRRPWRDKSSASSTSSNIPLPRQKYDSYWPSSRRSRSRSTSLQFPHSHSRKNSKSGSGSWSRGRSPKRSPKGRVSSRSRSRDETRRLEDDCYRPRRSKGSNSRSRSRSTERGQRSSNRTGGGSSSRPSSPLKSETRNRSTSKPTIGDTSRSSSRPSSRSASKTRSQASSGNNDGNNADGGSISSDTAKRGNIRLESGHAVAATVDSDANMDMDVEVDTTASHALDLPAYPMDSSSPATPSSAASLAMAPSTTVYSTTAPPSTSASTVAAPIPSSPSLNNVKIEEQLRKVKPEESPDATVKMDVDQEPDASDSTHTPPQPFRQTPQLVQEPLEPEQPLMAVKQESQQEDISQLQCQGQQGQAQEHQLQDERKCEWQQEQQQEKQDASDRYFLMRCRTESELLEAQKDNMWPTHPTYHKKLQEAYNTTSIIYLIYTFKDVRQFCAIARMASGITWLPMRTFFDRSKYRQKMKVEWVARSCVSYDEITCQLQLPGYAVIRRHGEELGQDLGRLIHNLLLKNKLSTPPASASVDTQLKSVDTSAHATSVHELDNRMGSMELESRPKVTEEQAGSDMETDVPEQRVDDRDGNRLSMDLGSSNDEDLKAHLAAAPAEKRRELLDQEDNDMARGDLEREDRISPPRETVVDGVKTDPGSPARVGSPVDEELDHRVARLREDRYEARTNESRMARRSHPLPQRPAPRQVHPIPSRPSSSSYHDRERRDSYRSDSYRSDPYRLEPYRSETYRLDSYRESYRSDERWRISSKSRYVSPPPPRARSPTPEKPDRAGSIVPKKRSPSPEPVEDTYSPPPVSPPPLDEAPVKISLVPVILSKSQRAKQRKLARQRPLDFPKPSSS